MAFDPEKVTIAPVAVQALATLEKYPDGSVRGQMYVSSNNMPGGHIDVRATSMDALKMLINGVTQWIVQNDKVILRPNGRI